MSEIPLVTSSRNATNDSHLAWLKKQVITFCTRVFVVSFHSPFIFHRWFVPLAVGGMFGGGFM